MDGDGVADCAVGDPLWSTEWWGMHGRAVVISSSTGATLFDWKGPIKYLEVGTVVADAGDIDGDGAGNVAVVQTPTGGLYGGVAVRSGNGGGVLHFYPSDPTYWNNHVRSVGDINGDGVEDLAVAPFYTVQVWSGLGPIVTYGTSCAGLRARWLQAPSVGSGTFVLTLAGAPAGAPVAAIFGASDSSWLGIPLPLELASIGAPGCQLLASIGPIAYSAADAASWVEFTAAIPSEPWLAGVQVFSQWVVVDAAANPAGLAWSEGLAITIQP